MTNLWRDIRFGFRLLLKNPGFTAIAILALALGIGANTAIYSVVYATLLAPLPYHDPNQLVIVWSKIQGNKNGVAAGDYLDWRAQNTVFQGLVCMDGLQREPRHREPPGTGSSSSRHARFHHHDWTATDAWS